MTIKVLIFDLDGVLVDSRELHYEALNMALNDIDPKFVINRQEHLAKYDGLPTSVKLNMVTLEKGLPVSYHGVVWKNKQMMTLRLINEMSKDERVCNILSELKKKGYSLACASNSVFSTLKQMLLKKGFLEYIDYFISNEDVDHPKPHPEMYLKCIKRMQAEAHECMIMEDSDVGKKAAISSKAHLCPIIDSLDLTLEKLLLYIKMADDNQPEFSIDGTEEIKPSYGSLNSTERGLQIVIPMAGHGSRFKKEGYNVPKPLIDVKGKPMIQRVVENMGIDAEFTFIVQQEHIKDYPYLPDFLDAIAPGAKVVETNGVTEGAACSVLLAKSIINNDRPLLVVNSDQWCKWNSARFYYVMRGVDAGLATFTGRESKWSFASLDEDGWVSRVAEKDPISDIASVGIYYYAKGSDFVKYAEQMIAKNIRTNGEFYICPVFNEMIADGKKVKTYFVDEMHGLGTPEDLELFLKNHDSNMKHKPQ